MIRSRFSLGRFLLLTFATALMACTLLLLLTDDTRTEDPSPVPEPVIFQGETDG